MDIGTESELVADLLEECREILDWDRNGFVTRFADQMLVVVIEGDVPFASLLAQTHLMNDSESIEFVERPVDG